MAWLYNIAYFAILAAVSPIIAWRIAMHGKYRTGWSEKLFGRVPRRGGDRPCLWLHAVSVGEVLQLEPVVEQLRRRMPGAEIVISTTTPTGRAVALKTFSEHRVIYFPLDFSWAVRTALRRIRPSAVVLVELELWPNFIRQAHREGIPLALVNGRVSEKSFRGYRRIRPVMAPMLRCFERLCMQNEIYANRLIELGAAPEQVEITGSIKFDRITIDRANPKTAELRRTFGIGDDETVFIAGSTQDPEETYAIDAYQQLCRKFPGLRLILVPRHKERFDAVADLIRARGHHLVRRSQPPRNTSAAQGGPPILLLDTLGELAACWGLADVAFVGGSLTNRGGQNMIEPAGYGAAVLFGPNTHNFRDVVELLLSNRAARVVRNAAELTETVRNFLAHRDVAEAQGRRAQNIVLGQSGATTRTVNAIAELSGFATPTRREAA